MKTKLRRFVSILSAMVLMILCAVPAFAEDIGTTDNNMTNIRQAISYMKQQIVEKGGTLDDKNYIAVWSYPNDYAINVKLISFPNNSINLTNGKYSFEHYVPDIYCDMYKYDSSKWDDYDRYTISISQSTSTTFDGNQEFFIDDSSSKYSWHIIDTNMKITNNGIDVTPVDPNAPPVPFIVDYSPSLSEGMSRKGTLVAPGASNNGQEIESNGLNVRVTLTDEFIKLRDSYDELKDYTYEFVCYITTSPPEKSSYEKSVKNAVYTSLDYGKYMYTTSGVVDDVTDDNKEPTEWIKAEGINAGYIIGKGGTVKNVTINLENLDSSQFTADTKLYIVVYGRLTSLSGPTPDYFDLDNQGYLCNQGSLNTKQIVTVNADPETGEGIDVVMPDYYCVTSTAFNYKDYPEYKPKIFKNGAEMDTNKPFTDYLDKKLTPDYMYDYDMDKNGESGLAPDDFEKYEEQKNLDKNFGSVDFGLDSIKSVFDGSSDFFKFLTASIGILPTTFLTILISFFVVMLAICVVKWVLK